MSERAALGLMFALALVLAAGRAQAQAPRTARQLQAAVPPLSAVPLGPQSAELTIRWLVASPGTGDPLPPGAAPAVPQLQVVGRGAAHGPLVRERDPQWSPDELVVVVLDAAGRETSWQKVRDPRLVRAEFPGPNGELQGRLLHRPVAELIVTVPDLATAAALQLYETYAFEGQRALRPLAQVRVAQP